MLELDVLLEPFFETAFTALSESGQRTFMALLEQDDSDLLSWFQHKTEPDDAEMAKMVQIILDRAKS